MRSTTLKAHVRQSEGGQHMGQALNALVPLAGRGSKDKPLRRVVGSLPGRGNRRTRRTGKTGRCQAGPMGETPGNHGATHRASRKATGGGKSPQCQGKDTKGGGTPQEPKEPSGGKEEG